MFNGLGDRLVFSTKSRLAGLAFAIDSWELNQSWHFFKVIQPYCIFPLPQYNVNRNDLIFFANSAAYASSLISSWKFRKLLKCPCDQVSMHQHSKKTSFRLREIFFCYFTPNLCSSFLNILETKLYKNYTFICGPNCIHLVSLKLHLRGIFVPAVHVNLSHFHQTTLRMYL